MWRSGNCQTPGSAPGASRPRSDQRSRRAPLRDEATPRAAGHSARPGEPPLRLRHFARSQLRRRRTRVSGATESLCFGPQTRESQACSSASIVALCTSVIHVRRAPVPGVHGVRADSVAIAMLMWNADALNGPGASRDGSTVATKYDGDQPSPAWPRTQLEGRPNFSPTSVHERPNTIENRGVPETREQDDSTTCRTRRSLQNLHPRFKSGRRLQLH